MIDPPVSLPVRAGWFLLAALSLGQSSPAADPPPTPLRSKPAPVPGQFVHVREPITSETVVEVGTAARQFIKRYTSQGVRPVLVFEFETADAPPGTSSFGASYELARVISEELEGGMTVAYVPHELRGFAVLAALACDDIVMGVDASLGPITPEGQAAKQALKGPIQDLAIRKGRDPELVAGMLDRDIDLQVVRTADKQLHFVSADGLSAFRRSHQVVDEHPAWEAGRRGVLTAARARDEGISKLLAENPAEVARFYNLPGQASSDDPTLGQVIRPVWIQVQGPIDTAKKAYLSRRLEQAKRERVNLIFFEFDSLGGRADAADDMAELIVNLTAIKTIAFIDDRALGVAILPVLACHDIIFRKESRMGDVRQLITGGNNEIEDLNERLIQSVAGKAVHLAEKRGHPVAVARAMVEPEAILVEAKDAHSGASTFVLQSQVAAEPNRFLDPEVRKSAGHVLTISGEEAVTYRLGQVVVDVEDLKALYGLRGKPIRVDGPTWVDSFVTVLNDPIVSWLLLFVGLFMLVVEMKMPGIGLPAVVSASAFLLFFWSRYLSGTADQLEIILFVIGILCLALELFVFPGFGVFGLSGVLLILASIVMASHTFVWPTQDYEYREMGHTLIRVLMAMAAVGCGAVALARYFPSLPVFNRLVLKPEPWLGVLEDAAPKTIPDEPESLTFLIGETGRTTTVLRPSGKARFGSLVVDVTADGYFIEADRLVAVLDVQGHKVVVKRVEA